MIAEVCITSLAGEFEFTRTVSFPDDAIAGRVACSECSGSGWWGFAPYAVADGPCIDCKGTGRVWVGLS